MNMNLDAIEKVIDFVAKTAPAVGGVISTVANSIPSRDNTSSRRNMNTRLIFKDGAPENVNINIYMNITPIKAIEYIGDDYIDVDAK